MDNSNEFRLMLPTFQTVERLYINELTNEQAIAPESSTPNKSHNASNLKDVKINFYFSHSRIRCFHTLNWNSVLK